MTLTLRRKPGISMPELWICWAVARGPMSVVSTQKMANIAPPITMNVRSTPTRMMICQGSCEVPSHHIQSCGFRIGAR